MVASRERPSSDGNAINSPLNVVACVSVNCDTSQMLGCSKTRISCGIHAIEIAPPMPTIIPQK